MVTNKGKTYVCLLDLAMDLIRGKWKAVLLCHMYDGPQRFLELQRITNGVSHKVLTEKLKELEDDNLIVRTDYFENPPRVEYSLTTMGKELTTTIKEIENWAKKYF